MSGYVSLILNCYQLNECFDAVMLANMSFTKSHMFMNLLLELELGFLINILCGYVTSFWMLISAILLSRWCKPLSESGPRGLLQHREFGDAWVDTTLDICEHSSEIPNRDHGNTRQVGIPNADLGIGH